MEARVIKLAPRLDLGGAASLQQQLFEADAEPSVIDAQDVIAVDTSCLQLLCAFVRATTAVGHPVMWRDVTPALRDSARRLGLADVLGLPKSGV